MRVRGCVLYNIFRGLRAHKQPRKQSGRWPHILLLGHWAHILIFSCVFFSVQPVAYSFLACCRSNEFFPRGNHDSTAYNSLLRCGTSDLPYLHQQVVYIHTLLRRTAALTKVIGSWQASWMLPRPSSSWFSCTASSRRKASSRFS